jgi:hypothetical protein
MQLPWNRRQPRRVGNPAKAWAHPGLVTPTNIAAAAGLL